MVLRQDTMPPKVVPPGGEQQPGPHPPYPVTPSTPTSTPFFAEGKSSSVQPAESSPTKDHGPNNVEDEDSEGSVFEWDASDDDDEGKSDLPAPLRVGGNHSSTLDAKSPGSHLPATLRVGPQGEIPRKSLEKQRDDALTAHPPDPRPWETAANTERAQHELASNNPYLSRTSGSGGEADAGLESSAAIWGAPAPTPHMPKKNDVELPVDMTANLSLNDTQSTNPFRAASIPDTNTTPHDSANIWQAQSTTAQELPASNYTKPIATLDPHQSESSLDWNPQADISTFDAFSSRNHGLSDSVHPGSVPGVHRTWEEQQEWDKSERQRRELEAHEAAEKALIAERERQAEEEWYSGEQTAWNERPATNLDNVPPPPGPPPSKQPDPASHTLLPVEEVPPPRPPKPEISLATDEPQVQSQLPSGGAPVISPTTMKRQRSETYQIKQINWHDYSSATNPRRSPILIQNANGPCPLLALVNALVLATPSTIETALTETLRTREQVSLGLLLDAVFDELMSGRHGDAAAALPDVSDLYAFLINLHTGMNVNPSFIPVTPKIPNLIDFSDESHTPVASNGLVAQAGGFEETRELIFYGTFSVPLIHGWLPSQDHPAAIALARSGKTYEDAQNLQFREEDLEHKLQNEGLSIEEAQLLEDVGTIKYFLSNSATQLTSYGLETIKKALKPGAIAILFRNDHFSTLYKHPHTGQLLTLVTDAGFASHDEVVWQSLVDVTGEGSEFLSGDFRPVGNMGQGTTVQEPRDQVDQSAWTTVTRRNPRHHHQNQQSGSYPPHSEQPLPGPPGPPPMDSIGDRLNPSATTTTSTGPHQDSSNTLNQSPSTPSSFRPRTTSEQEDHDLALALQLQEEEEDRHRREQAARRREEDLSQQYIASENQSSPRRSSGAAGGGGAAGPTGARQRPRPSEGPPPALPQRHDQDVQDDLPPPSYEQAARRPAYHPPGPQYSRGSQPQNPQNQQMMGTTSTYTPHPSINPVVSHQSVGGTHAPVSRRQSTAAAALADNQQSHRARRGRALSQREQAAGVQGLEDEGKKDCIVM